MRALNKLDPPVYGPMWPEWMEDPRQTYEVEQRAQRIRDLRETIAAAQANRPTANIRYRREERKLRQIEECRKVATEIVESMGSTMAHMLETNGWQLLRGKRSPVRLQAWRVLRGMGYTYPVIGAAFDVSHSTVFMALNRGDLTPTHNGA